MLATIEVNDAGILTFLQDQLVSESPGYAVIHDERLLVGEEAIRSNRLYPHWVNNRFWQQLDMEPISSPIPQVRHNADLAFAHLAAIWASISDQADEVIFSLPSSFRPEQTGLLVGIARECGLPLTGIVDSAIAAAGKTTGTAQVLFLDINLHQIRLTKLSKGDYLTREQTQVVGDMGLSRLWDKWANIMATLFIQSTRFDPMHDAASEQLLYDQIPSWIRSRGDIQHCEFELDWAGSTNKITFSSEQLLNACTDLYPAIVQQVRQMAGDQPLQLLVSHRFDGFPGLMDSLSLLKDCAIMRVDPLNQPASIIEYADFIRSSGDQLSFITRLSLATSTSSASSAKTLLGKQGPPTHLLLNNRAVPIGRAYKLGMNLSEGLQQDDSDTLCTLFLQGQQMQILASDAQMVMLNGKPLSDESVVEIGDAVTVSGVIVQLIGVAAETSG